MNVNKLVRKLLREAVIPAVILDVLLIILGMVAGMIAGLSGIVQLMTFQFSVPAFLGSIVVAYLFLKANKMVSGKI